jgi:class 3 adenylate cyclase
VDARIPETHFVRGPGGDIAYQAFGSGEKTIIGLPPVISNIEVLWEDPDAEAWLRRLAGFAKFVHFDKRGQGLSERFNGVPTLEERTEDLTAVMDAVGVERAVLGGISEGGLMAAFYAASHPERVEGLILISTFARVLHADDYPVGPDPSFVEATVDAWERAWATPETLSVQMFAADRVGDPDFLRWMNRFERGSSTPAAFAGAMRLDVQLDIRHVLDQVRVPTTVVHRRDDPLVDVAHGRYLADHIAGARFVELPGAGHAPYWGDTAMDIAGEFEEMITGQRHQSPDDRVLATVLFTDVVGSTERAATLGDERWRHLLDEMDRIVDRHVSTGRGRVVKSTGDGHLAVFDAPARAVRAADAMAREVDVRLGVQLRAGLHTGEIELRGLDIGGIAVHIGARVSGLAEPNQVLVSRTVTDLVPGSGLEFFDAGAHPLKGLPGEYQLYALVR